jgi:hypothetical protein
MIFRCPSRGSLRQCNCGFSFEEFDAEFTARFQFFSNSEHLQVEPKVGQLSFGQV